MVYFYVPCNKNILMKLVGYQPEANFHFWGPRLF